MRIPFILLLVGLAHSAELAAIDAITTPDAIEIRIEQHAATGNTLVLWLPSEAGPQIQDEKIAEQLAALHTEVWRVDLLEARFLPLAESSLLQIPASDVQTLIEAAQSSGKRLYLIAQGRAAIPALLGAQVWKHAHPDANSLGGIVLVSPKLFVETPDPGEMAQLMPIVTASNLPIYWLQPKLSPWFWQLPTAMRGLEQGGADLFVRTLPGVRDRFYYRPDATIAEQAMAEQLVGLITQGIGLLDRLPPQVRQVSQQLNIAPMRLPEKKDRTLRPFTADPKPPRLQLANRQGESMDLAALRGKVVLINFWATWCPPCVKEMPSMQVLYERFAGQPFEILAVNMAETTDDVRTFLAGDIRVRFPILMDHDGVALRAWGVFAFPTSFVVDKSGHIRYALFGSIDWTEPEVMGKIQGLVREGLADH